MAGTAVPALEGVRVYPPPPKGFDALTASKTELARHGVPQRPDPRTQPGLAALWEQRVRRYQDFEHLEPKLLPPDKPAVKPTGGVAAGVLLDGLVSCGYELFSFGPPFVIFSGKWTIPNLNYTPAPSGLPNLFHTFFGLGFLDIHVEMTVDAAQNVTARITTTDAAPSALTVRPGDAISATLCLQAGPDGTTAGTAYYFLANETTSQTVTFTAATGFPPAAKVNAGIGRGNHFNGPPEPLARFGVVYFDELIAWTSDDGTRLLTNGTPTPMVELNGSTLAQPQRLNDNAFSVDYRGA
jgi:Peptidase A4 family